MHFRENVKMYYVRELQQCFWAAGWGGILILTWAIFFRSAQPATLERGLARLLWCSVLFLGLVD